MLKCLRFVGWVVASVVFGALGPEAHADVVIHDDAACLDTATIEAQLGAIVTRRLGDLDAVHVRVSGTLQAGAISVTLGVTTRGGRGLLDRTYQLQPVDCASVGDLVSAVIDRLFTELPVSSWRAASVTARLDRNPDAAPVVPVWVELALVTAITAALAPQRANGELGLRLDRGRHAHRGGVGLLVRDSFASPLAGGQVSELTILAGAGWRYVHDAWQTSLDLRGGVVRIAGSGFDENLSAWRPAVEASAAVALRWRGATLGLGLTASPLSQNAVTTDRMASVKLPRVYVGMIVTVPLWRETF